LRFELALRIGVRRSKGVRFTRRCASR
jgi:hypothetical protein